MKKLPGSQQEFVAILQRAGLDPAQHDIGEMYEAWLMLNKHMQRLRSPERAAGQQALSLFDPTSMAGSDPE